MTNKPITFLFLLAVIIAIVSSFLLLMIPGLLENHLGIDPVMSVSIILTSLVSCICCASVLNNK